MLGSSNWSDLPGDVWCSVGFKLDDAADRIRFRAVSKLFRSHLPYRQPPWLMLSEYHDSDSEEVDEDGEADSVPPRRRFVILGGQNYYKLHLPQAHFAHCVGSTNNWVITLKTDIVVRLLNPFSGVEIDLPDNLTFGDSFYQNKPLPPNDIYVRDSFLRKAIICPTSSSTVTDFLVIAVKHRHGIVAMARPGDSFWTNFETQFKEHNGVEDIIFFKERLYAINTWGLLLSSEDINCPNPPVQLSVAAEEFDKFELQLLRLIVGSNHNHKLYLVEWSGHLLLVIKFINVLFKVPRVGDPETLPFYKTDKFQIYMFDFVNRSWMEIKSLGEYSLFLGFNTSVSVLASDYFGFVKKNCIYFTDDYTTGYRGSSTPGGYDMGVFNLDDNTISPHYKGKSICYSSPPIWIVPN